jgi:glucose-6-phosphate 1-epimerase
MTDHSSDVPDDASGELPRLHLTHPAGASAELSLYGGQLLSWRPAGGEEWLFLSRSARFRRGEGIRGGIPVMFPQFADRGPLPKHGFARTEMWRRADDGADASRATLELADSSATRQPWPHAFRLQLHVELGAHDVNVTLAVENTGDAPFTFTCALHGYFRIGDVRRAGVEGLQGAAYLDKTEDMAERRQEDARLAVSGLVDRIYGDAPGTVSLVDDVGARELRVRNRGFRDVVVWNPWQELADELPDMDDDEYLRMLCVEAAQVLEPLTLEPGAEWRGSQLLAGGA